jgi:hypothetical protein
MASSPVLPLAELRQGAPGRVRFRASPIDLGQASADEIEAAVDGCPSAALRSRRVGGTAPAAPPELEVSPMPNGPLLMRGPIRAVRADGSSEELPRAALWQSNNKLFRDGTHREVWFKG